VVDGHEINGRSVNCEAELAMADRILSDQAGLPNQPMEPSPEELVSPSICSANEGDLQQEDP